MFYFKLLTGSLLLVLAISIVYSHREAEHELNRIKKELGDIRIEFDAVKNDFLAILKKIREERWKNDQ